MLKNGLLPLFIGLMLINNILACEVAPAVQGEDISLTMMHDGVERSYVLHLPSGYDCETPLPLVFGVHGYTGSGSIFENRWAQIFDHVNRHNYVGVFPDGMTASADAPWAKGFNDLGSRNDSGPDGLTCIPPPYAYP
jgi:poly(3-hydroxybutyrate) depolymerase